MDVFEFILKIVDKTTWPICLLIVLVFMKRPLGELIPFLKKAKFKDLELEFDKEINEVKAQAEKLFVPDKNDWKTQLLNMVQTFPNATVLEVWKIIDQKAEKFIFKISPSYKIDEYAKYKSMQEFLIKEGVIEVQKGKVFDDLRQLRNKVAHTKNYILTQKQVLNYVSIGISLIEYLEHQYKKA